MKTIEIVLRQVYRRSKREENHNQRVSEYCEQIASAMNISEDEIKSARLAGILHDIGKIMVPSNILNKLDRLTEKEWEEVKKHPVTSYQILKSIDEYTYLAESVLYHHERFDGKGYPEGLKGDSIPLLSKIIAVADAYESMTSDRNYKERKSKQEAIDELIYNKGTQFDPEITGIFINKILNQENN